MKNKGIYVFILPPKAEDWIWSYLVSWLLPFYDLIDMPCLL